MINKDYCSRGQHFFGYAQVHSVAVTEFHITEVYSGGDITKA